MLITQNNLEFKILTLIFKIYARISIYQALRHPWKQSGRCIPEQAVFKIVKKRILLFFLSFCFLGLTQDSLDHSPWFEYKSTPFVACMSLACLFCVIRTAI